VPEGRRADKVYWQATSIWQKIAESIEDDIVSGAFVGGQQIRQARIAERFGVSVATVREALRHLESDGLVVHYPNRGVFVADVSTEELFGMLLPMRRMLEEYAVGHTVTRITETQWEELTACVQMMEAGADVNDLAAINEADIRFHELTVLWSGQPHTVQLWQAVQARTRAQIYRLAPRHRDAGEVAREHAYLVQQFRTGDQALISEALEEHIIVSAKDLLAGELDSAVVGPDPTVQAAGESL
jgi:DNA-binding GntR family transcriptional regulator